MSRMSLEGFEVSCLARSLYGIRVVSTSETVCHT